MAKKDTIFVEDIFDMKKLLSDDKFYFEQNGVELRFRPRPDNLVCVSIDDVFIEDLFEIPRATSYSDTDIGCRITENAVLYTLARINRKDKIKREGFPDKTLLGVTKDNVYVYISDKDMEHMKAHSDVDMKHVTKAISTITTPDKNSKITKIMENVDLHEIIGKDHCVEVTPEDDVRMEKRPGRQTETPMVYGKKAKDTSLINVGMCVDKDGEWTLFTSFYGVLAPKEPNDECLTEEERSESEAFWSTHALVPVEESEIKKDEQENELDEEEEYEYEYWDGDEYDFDDEYDYDDEER